MPVESSILPCIPLTISQTIIKKDEVRLRIFDWNEFFPDWIDFLSYQLHEYCVRGFCEFPFFFPSNHITFQLQHSNDVEWLSKTLFAFQMLANDHKVYTAKYCYL